MKVFLYLYCVLACATLAYGANTTKSSFACKNCIDAGNKFCPSARYQDGQCCTSEEFCRKESFCSDDASIKTNLRTQYWLCPTESRCYNSGWSRELIPLTNGEKKIYQKLDGKVVQGDICNYQIRPPMTGDDND